VRIGIFLGCKVYLIEDGFQGINFVSFITIGVSVLFFNSSKIKAK
jgi:hypothetical protein